MRSNHCNSKTHRRRGDLHSNAITTAVALGLYLLAFFATLCAGRVDYRGHPMTPHTSIRGARVEYGSTHRLRRLQETVGSDATAAPTATPTMAATREIPTCASVYVPPIAGNLTGTYTHRGRYSDKRPVYINPDNGNNLFAQTAASAASNTTTNTWYLTQSDSSYTFFLSIESDVFEPIELEGIEPWVRNNDATCSRSGGGGACTTWMLLSCDALTADLFSTPSPAYATASPDHPNATAVGNSSTFSTANGTDFAHTATPAPSPLSNNTFSAGNATAALGIFSASPTSSPTASPTPSPTVPEDLIPATDSTTTSTTTTTDETHSTSCMTLEVSQGGARTGVYLMSSPDYSNSRPGYVVSGGYREDEIFSKQMSICAPGWGAVNSTWADATGELPATASVRDVWLLYAAGLDLDVGGGCSVDVWIVTGGGFQNLSGAGGDTFIAVSDAGDPSGVTQWARFTPATETESSTLEDDSWVGVNCADG